MENKKEKIMPNIKSGKESLEPILHAGKIEFLILIGVYFSACCAA